MANSFTLKQHDTWPPLLAILTDNGGAIDLTSATAVKLILKAGASAMGGGACTITSALGGAISYTWQGTDTAAVNTFNAEFEITWSGGAISTVPNDSYFTVNVVADLG